MPWDCCAEELLDTVRECPTCGTTKVSWTTTFRATRLFVIPRKGEAWVELELRDALGSSLGGTRYRVVGLMGDVHEGALDEAGFARVDEVSEGLCKITFPDLDGAEWDWEVPRSVAPEGAGAPREAPAWVELELLDTDGEPLAGERYRVVLPDGEVREGKLDASGRAREESPQAGTCKVSFPDLDQAEWGTPEELAVAQPPAEPAAAAR